MKQLLASLVRRNLLATLAVPGILAVLRSGHGHWGLSAICMLIFAFGLFLWANWLLVKRGHPIIAVLLSLMLTPVVEFSAGVGLHVLGRNLVEREYASQGLQLMQGCNAAAANQAEFRLFAIDDRLAELTNAPDVNAQQILQLRAARIVAQEAARVTSEDCRRRGHCDSHPWKTNWAAVKLALEDSDRAEFGTNSYIQR